MIRANGAIAELKNRADDPANFFRFEQRSLTAKSVMATWHTHPGPSANLSIDDFYFFKSWPNLFHFIISTDEVACYFVCDDGKVHRVDEEDDLSPRAPG